MLFAIAVPINNSIDKKSDGIYSAEQSGNSASYDEQFVMEGGFLPSRADGYLLLGIGFWGGLITAFRAILFVVFGHWKEGIFVWIPGFLLSLTAFGIGLYLLA